MSSLPSINAKATLKTLALVSALAVALSSAAFGSATKQRCGSISKTCSGYGELCEDCGEKYYYLYINQHACISNGEVTSESHSFSLSGSLQAGTKAKIVGTLNDWVIWETSETFLAIPLHSQQNLYAKKKTAKTPQGLDLNGWHQLCQGQ